MFIYLSMRNTQILSGDSFKELTRDNTLMGAVVNRALHSLNGDKLEITSTVPLILFMYKIASTVPLILFIFKIASTVPLILFHVQNSKYSPFNIFSCSK